MSYSRRNFLKAASAGIALTAVGGESAFLAGAAVVALPEPMTSERATFIVNGKPHLAEYEARTTLWEVISMKLGMTGTNRSCNRASCGACSVLVDGTPVYSCHTLATEAASKNILTIEGVGDAKQPPPPPAHRPHPRSRRLRFLHRRMGRHRQSTSRQEPQSLRRRRKSRARRTHLPLLRLPRNHPHRNRFRRRLTRRVNRRSSPPPIPSSRSNSPWSATTPPTAGHPPGD